MIGVVVDNVTDNAQNYCLFRALNDLTGDCDCYIFTNTVQAMPMKNKFAILQQVEALNHKGILIASSILNAQIVANSLTPTEKYYYLWCPEWLTLQSVGVYQLTKMLFNDDIGLIARSQSHADLLSKLFKPPKGVVYNWNAKQLKELIL